MKMKQIDYQLTSSTFSSSSSKWKIFQFVRDNNLYIPWNRRTRLVQRGGYCYLFSISFPSIVESWICSFLFFFTIVLSILSRLESKCLELIQTTFWIIFLSLIFRHEPIEASLYRLTYTKIHYFWFQS